MKKKFLILDFGNVIALPATGDWDMTPKFQDLIDLSQLDKEKWSASQKKYDYILSTHVTSLEEEEAMFYEYYDSILRDCDYPLYQPQLAREIAKNRTYEDDKYALCENAKEELEELNKQYTLIMLTDNWPCVFDYLRRHQIDQYFQKVYVSSIYGCVKKDKIFFDYPIQDFHIQEGEAIFVDDDEANLMAAVEKKLNVFQMDRLRKIEKSKFTIIHNLKEESLRY